MDDIARELHRLSGGHGREPADIERNINNSFRQAVMADPGAFGVPLWFRAYTICLAGLIMLFPVAAMVVVLAMMVWIAKAFL